MLSVDFFSLMTISHSSHSFVRQQRTNITNLRTDGWLKTQLGNFNSGLKEDHGLLLLMMMMNVVESRSHIRKPGGFILEGTEVRPN